MKNKLILLIFAYTCICCSKRTDEITFTVTDFSQKRIDTLIPHKYTSYHTSIIKIKGFCNDTIIVKEQGSFDFKFVGNIDTIIRTDYYGIYNKIFLFEPYKCTSGKLNIEYHL